MKFPKFLGVNKEATVSITPIQQDGVKPSQIPSGEFSCYKSIPRTFYKRLIDKQLTIILIENTDKVAKQKDMFLKNVKRLVTSELVCVINYGTAIRRSGIFDISAFDESVLMCEDDIGDVACLYDALVDLEILFTDQLMSITETEQERVRINQIDVIGIGTCTDKGSKVPKEVGIDLFGIVASNPKVTTKYFCLTEESFMNAAEIGFRSIGAILRNY